MRGKQKWGSPSSQPTLRASKLLALEPSSLFTKPQEKYISIPISFISQMLIPDHCQPPIDYGHTNLQYFSYDLFIYDPPALQHSTRSCDLIFGDDASSMLSSHSVVFATCLFSPMGQQELFNNYIHSCPPSTYFIK